MKKNCLHGKNCTFAHGIKELRKNLHKNDIFVNKANISNHNVFNVPTTCYSEIHSDSSLSFSINNEQNSINRGMPISKIVNHLSNSQLTQTQIVQPIQLQNVSASIDSLGNVKTLQTIHPQSTPAVSVSTLTSSTGLSPSTAQIVGAIDSATGNFVNLIPVQTVQQNHPPSIEQSNFLFNSFILIF